MNDKFQIVPQQNNHLVLLIAFADLTSDYFPHLLTYNSHFNEALLFSPSLVFLSFVREPEVGDIEGKLGIHTSQYICKNLAH